MKALFKALTGRTEPPSKPEKESMNHIISIIYNTPKKVSIELETNVEEFQFVTRESLLAAATVAETNSSIKEELQLSVGS